MDWQGTPSERNRLFTYLNAYFQQGFTNPIDQAINSLNLPVEGCYKLDEIPYDFIQKRLSVAIR